MERRHFPEQRHYPPKRPNHWVVEELVEMQSSQTDPFGSYTGVPVNPYETPVQDADDL